MGAGLIIEPILSEGGDFHASHDFFRGLQKACKEAGSFFIVDEVQTGVGATGYMWAHEAWKLEEPADIVTFSKKALCGGYYYQEHMTPKQGYRIFNTWMGDAPRVLQFNAVLKVIEEQELIHRVTATGKKLRAALDKAAAQYPDYVSNVRGPGTFLAFEASTAALRDQLASTLKNNGVIVGINGVRTCRFRPALTLADAHVEQFEHIFMTTLRQLADGNDAPGKKAKVCGA